MTSKKLLLILTSYLLLLTSYLHFPTPIHADWPMPGHNLQRTSNSPEDNFVRPTQPLWAKPFTDFIPSKAQLVTKTGSGSIPDLILVPTSKGLYALRASDGSLYWFYQTSMPLGNSPTIHNNVVYFGVFDKTVHAIHIANGQKIWQTAEADAGYDTNPLVFNNTVFIGNRDGRFYAFNATNGSLLWSYKTGGRISYSAAASKDLTKIYFASNDSYAYALNSSNGTLYWKSPKLPGDGFYSWWPVVTDTHVFFAGSTNYGFGSFSLVQLDKNYLFPVPDDGTSVGPVDANGWMDGQKVIDYHTQLPHRQTFFALNITTGKEAFKAPFLWVGNPSGNRYPPAIGSNNLLYNVNVWRNSGFWLKGRVSAWQIGTTKIRDAGIGSDSADENGAISILGNKLFYVHKEAQAGQYVDYLTSTTNRSIFSAWSTTTNLEYAFPGYSSEYINRKYGNYILDKFVGSHGNVNPLVPIGNKVCFHNANGIACYTEL